MKPLCLEKRPKVTQFDNHVAVCDNKKEHKGPHWDRVMNVRWFTRPEPSSLRYYRGG